MKRTSLPSLQYLLAISSALLLAACAGSEPAADGQPRASNLDDAGAARTSLEGTSWVLAELAGRPPHTGETPTAQFQSGQVRGTDGCNRYSTPFATSGDTITIGPNGMTTQMACSPEVMAQAQSFRDALERARRFRITDNRLELVSSQGTTLLIMAAQPTTLVGTWEVTAFNNGRQAVVGVLEQAPMEITFASDGTVAGSAGCNRFTSTFVADGAAFRFGPAAATRRTCPGDGVMEQEQAFLSALSTVATMRREGDALEFRTADDALAMMLRRLKNR